MSYKLKIVQMIVLLDFENSVAKVRRNSDTRNFIQRTGRFFQQNGNKFIM